MKNRIRFEWWSYRNLFGRERFNFRIVAEGNNEKLAHCVQGYSDWRDCMHAIDLINVLDAPVRRVVK